MWLLLLGFVFAGLPVITECLPTPGKVYKDCEERGSPVNGRIRILLHSPTALMVLYSCDHGYQREGPLYSICVRGNWTSVLPSCIKTFSGEVNDGVNLDPGVLVSLEELPSTQRIMTQKRIYKKVGKRKKKRKRKYGKMKYSSITVTNMTITGRLDTTCQLSNLGDSPNFVRPPQVPNSIGPKFVRKKLKKHKYLVAIYRCKLGYKLHNPQSRRLGCQNRKWIGRLPICLPRRKKIGCTNIGCDHDCSEIDGEPKCLCFKGFRQLGKACIDVNECSSDNGGCHNTCHNTPGSFFCGCYPGFRLSSDRISCIDVNECLSRNGHGPCNGQCTNVAGSYYCSCETIPGTRLAHDGVSCEDIDECSDKEFRLECSHSCVNTLGSAFCVCLPGYQLGHDWKTCEDIDECASRVAHCTHYCTNTPGSFTCSCNSGYVLDKDEQSCNDVNECSNFSENPMCSLICKTPTGIYNYSSDYKLSSDQRMCQPKEDICQQKNCSQNCTVENGNAICICYNGYELENDLTCTDVDECEEGTDGCSHYCVNEEGSFSCSCPNNMTLHADEKVCREIECDQTVCPNGCYIENGFVSCECRQGFRKIGSNCEDIDECLDGTNCSQLCRNTKGSYECFCDDGFYLGEDGKSCIDINECRQENICSDKHCINIEGGFLCECSPGFAELKGTSECEDIDECSLKTDEGFSVCSHFCINSLGTFKCMCPSGFILGKDLRSCEDIDECLENNEIITRCSHICVNELGSYHCECPQGFILLENNHTCVQLTGCDINNGGCSHICVNNSGYSVCECPENTIMSVDNVTCVEIPFCKFGYIFQENLSECIDTNECLNNNGNCPQQCENTEGSFYCTCNSGYQKDPTTQACVDIDECIENNTSSNACDQMCVNTAGSYKCECFDGFAFLEDGEECIDVNECLDEARCSQICINTHGSFRCECKQGFALTTDEKFCEDVDECFFNISKCTQICHNYEGGFSCDCNPGFKLINSSQCIEELNITIKEHKINQTSDFTDDILPFIRCVPELRFVLPINCSSMSVRIPQPETNMDWEKNVHSNPSWGKDLQTTLPYGTSIVQFIATNIISGNVSTCNITIHIRDAEKPMISKCPEDINVAIKHDNDKVTVLWKEPIISDNVHVAQVFQSKKSGTTFSKGTHLVTYVAVDSSSNIAICEFTVTISRKGQRKT